MSQFRLDRVTSPWWYSWGLFPRLRNLSCRASGNFLFNSLYLGNQVMLLTEQRWITKCISEEIIITLWIITVFKSKASSRQQKGHYILTRAKDQRVSPRLDIEQTSAEGIRRARWMDNTCAQGLCNSNTE